MHAYNVNPWDSRARNACEKSFFPCLLAKNGFYASKIGPYASKFASMSDENVCFCQYAP
jgi:hypothetical protein